MLGNLIGKEPLSEVSFVMDYIMLKFQEEFVTILNVPQLHFPDGRVIHRADQTFCNALVGLMNQSVAQTVLEEGESVTLVFQSGTKLVVPLTRDAVSGPEAIELPGGYIVFND